MPNDTKHRREHPDSIAPLSAKAEWRLLQGGPHLINTTTLGNIITSDIIVRPDLDKRNGENTGYSLGYNREATVRESTVQFEDLNFDTGKDQITPANMEKLKATAASINHYLVTHPEMSLSIRGHTDSVGSAEYNSTLSAQRAKASYDALSRLLDPSVRDRLAINTSGLGETELKEDCATESAVNRRVEFVAVSTQPTIHHEIIHLPTSAYTAMADKPFFLDLGMGIKTKEAYGRLSTEEANASVVFEPPPNALGRIMAPRLNVIVQDPENLRLLVRCDGRDATVPSIMQIDSTHLRIYLTDKQNPDSKKQVLADVEVRDPEGRPIDFEKVKLGTVNAKGEIGSVKTVLQMDIMNKMGQPLLRPEGEGIAPPPILPMQKPAISSNSAQR